MKTEYIPKHFISSQLDPILEEACKFRGGNPQRMRRLLMNLAAQVEGYTEPKWKGWIPSFFDWRKA
jgi:hypothetical protein